MATKAMTTKNMMDMINNYIQKFIESATNDYEEFTIDDFSTVWSDKENQDKLQKLIKSNLPTRKSSSDKKIKDNNKPKAARSAYIYFCNDNRQKIRDENPQMKITEITKILGVQWKELNKKAESNKKAREQLEKYKNLANHDKERATSELSVYVRPSDEVLLALKPTRGRKSSGEKRKKKEKGYPIAAKTAWLYFAEEMRPKLVKQNPNMSGKEITSLLSTKWKEEKENKKSKKIKKYEKLVVEDKKRYASAMEEYKKKLEEKTEDDDDDDDEEQTENNEETNDDDDEEKQSEDEEENENDDDNDE